MKSEQRSVQTSEAAEAASLPGFTQTGAVTAPDNLLLRSTCVLVQHFGLIYQTSVAFATQTAKHKGEPEKKSVFPISRNPCSFIAHLQIFFAVYQMHTQSFFLIFTPTFLCMCSSKDFAAQKRACRRSFDSPISLNRFLNCPCLFVVNAIICD